MTASFKTLYLFKRLEVSNIFFSVVNMSSFEPNKEHLRHVLIFLFSQRKKAAEAHRILVETYGAHALSVDTCERWFQRFRSGDFDVKDKERENRAPEGHCVLRAAKTWRNSKYGSLPTTNN